MTNSTLLPWPVILELVTHVARNLYPGDYEDVAQEVCVKIIEHPEWFPDPTTERDGFLKYVAAAMRSAWVDLQRATERQRGLRRRRDRDAQQPPPVCYESLAQDGMIDPNAEEGPGRIDAEDEVCRLALCGTPHYWRAALLFYEKGAEATAAELGLRVGTVRVYKSRCVDEGRALIAGACTNAH